MTRVDKDKQSQVFQTTDVQLAHVVKRSLWWEFPGCKAEVYDVNANGTLYWVLVYGQSNATAERMKWFSKGVRLLFKFNRENSIKVG